MSTEVVMPRLSDTMDSGTVSRWLKQEGEPVKRGEIIAEIETDKSNMELEAYANGVLARIIVKEGESADLGQPIALIAADAEEAAKLKDGGPGEDPKPEQKAAAPAEAEEAPQPAEKQPTGETPTSTEPQETASPDDVSEADQTADADAESGRGEGRLRASPLARRLASENSVELSEVRGSGPGGRITKEDVESFVQSRTETKPSEPAEAPSRAQAAGAVTGGGVRDGTPVDMTRIQRTIARRLTEARFTAPDFLLTSEIDMTQVRAALKSIAEIEDAPRIGPNDVLIKLTATALSQHREINAGWEGDTAVRYGRINIGNAVATPNGGLIVPVIADADTKPLQEISLESKALIEKARNKKLAPKEYEGGTFTISNLGMFGIDQFTSILNPPEACSLAVGAIVAKPVVIDGQIAVRERMRVTLTCDHRVVNGAEGAQFLRTLQRLLEHPMLALM
jgi:pyruvate dehydrogenase E2 component (dihydrolipoamide acetyltransferase)